VEIVNVETRLAGSRNRVEESGRQMALRVRRIAVAAFAFGVMSSVGVGAAGEATLAAAAASTGLYFVAALDPGFLDEKRYRGLAATQLTSVTPENQMKWGVVEPVRGTFNRGGRTRRLRRGA
jgi:GH35 family endo-1,4-beta-xylanase